MINIFPQLLWITVAVRLLVIVSDPSAHTELNHGQ